MTASPAAVAADAVDAAGPANFARAARTAARLAAMLGWSPHVFWMSTPAELRAALGLDLAPAAAPAAATDLARLKEAFPDGPAR